MFDLRVGTKNLAYRVVSLAILLAVAAEGAVHNVNHHSPSCLRAFRLSVSVSGSGSGSGSGSVALALAGAGALDAADAPRTHLAKIASQCYLYHPQPEQQWTNLNHFTEANTSDHDASAKIDSEINSVTKIQNGEQRELAFGFDIVLFCLKKKRTSVISSPTSWRKKRLVCIPNERRDWPSGTYSNICPMIIFSETSNIGVEVKGRDDFTLEATNATDCGTDCFISWLGGPSDFAIRTEKVITQEMERHDLDALGTPLPFKTSALYLVYVTAPCAPLRGFTASDFVKSNAAARDIVDDFVYDAIAADEDSNVENATASDFVKSKAAVRAIVDDFGYDAIVFSFLSFLMLNLVLVALIYAIKGCVTIGTAAATMYLGGEIEALVLRMHRKRWNMISLGKSYVESRTTTRNEESFEGTSHTKRAERRKLAKERKKKNLKNSIDEWSEQFGVPCELYGTLVKHDTGKDHPDFYGPPMQFIRGVDFFQYNELNLLGHEIVRYAVAQSGKYLNAVARAFMAGVLHGMIVFINAALVVCAIDDPKSIVMAAMRGGEALMPLGTRIIAAMGDAALTLLCIIYMRLCVITLSGGTRLISAIIQATPEYAYHVVTGANALTAAIRVNKCGLLFAAVITASPLIYTTITMQCIEACTDPVKLLLQISTVSVPSIALIVFGIDYEQLQWMFLLNVFIASLRINYLALGYAILFDKSGTSRGIQSVAFGLILLVNGATVQEMSYIIALLVLLERVRHIPSYRQPVSPLPITCDMKNNGMRTMRMNMSSRISTNSKCCITNGLRRHNAAPWVNTEVLLTTVRKSNRPITAAHKRNVYLPQDIGNNLSCLSRILNSVKFFVPKCEIVVDNDQGQDRSNLRVVLHAPISLLGGGVDEAEVSSSTSSSAPSPTSVSVRSSSSALASAESSQASPGQDFIAPLATALDAFLNAMIHSDKIGWASKSNTVPRMSDEGTWTMIPWSAWLSNPRNCIRYTRYIGLACTDQSCMNSLCEALLKQWALTKAGTSGKTQRKTLEQIIEGGIRRLMNLYSHDMFRIADTDLQTVCTLLDIVPSSSQENATQLQMIPDIGSLSRTSLEKAIRSQFHSIIARIHRRSPGKKTYRCGLSLFKSIQHVSAGISPIIKKSLRSYKSSSTIGAILKAHQLTSLTGITPQLLSLPARWLLVDITHGSTESSPLTRDESLDASATAHAASSPAKRKEHIPHGSTETSPLTRAESLDAFATAHAASSPAKRKKQGRKEGLLRSSPSGRKRRRRQPPSIFDTWFETSGCANRLWRELQYWTQAELDRFVNTAYKTKVVPSEAKSKQGGCGSTLADTTSHKQVSFVDGYMFCPPAGSVAVSGEEDERASHVYILPKLSSGTSKANVQCLSRYYWATLQAIAGSSRANHNAGATSLHPQANLCRTKRIISNWRRTQEKKAGERPYTLGDCPEYAKCVTHDPITIPTEALVTGAQALFITLALNRDSIAGNTHHTRSQAGSPKYNTIEEVLPMLMTEDGPGDNYVSQYFSFDVGTPGSPQILQSLPTAADAVQAMTTPPLIYAQHELAPKSQADTQGIADPQVIGKGFIPSTLWG